MSNSRTACCALVAALAGFACLPVQAAHPHTAHPALPPVSAQIAPDLDVAPVINSSRMVTYTWTPSRSFVVRSLSGVNTDIEVPEGESIEGFYLSNATDWSFHVTGDHRRVLIKPAQAGLYNTALLVTNARSYQLTLVSVPPDQTWFQRVSWALPTVNQGGTGVYWSPDNGGGHAAQGSAGGDPLTLNPGSMYFDYRVDGNAAFRPSAVFDDGVRTWLRFPSKSQDLPAIFAITDRQLDVMDYSVVDGYVVVPRVVNELVLRLNGEKVTIKRGCDPARCLK